MKSILSLTAICLLPTMLWSCGEQGQNKTSEVKRAVIPGSIANRLEMGQAYDKNRAVWGNLSCVTGKVTEQDLGGSATVEYARDMSYEKTMNSIAGELGVGVSFPVVSVEAKADYASMNSATDFRETHTLSYKYTTKRKFEVGSLRLSERGEFYSKNPGLLADRCKNEFVNEIDFGAMFNATLTLEFKNKEDKEKFGGSLKVDVLGGTVKVEGKLAVASEAEKKNIKIRLSGIQEGGDPRQLTSVITPDVASCDASNLAPCISAFRTLLTYGSNIKTQLTGPESYSVLSYKTESYADSGLEALVPLTIPFITSEVIETRETIESSLKTNRNDFNRANILLASFGDILPSYQAEALRAARDGFEKNKYELIRALQFCFDNPYSVRDEGGSVTIPCQENYNKIKTTKLVTVDRKALEIKPNANDYNDTLCKAARILAFKEGHLTEKQFGVYNKINYAPEYNQAGNRLSGIAGWGECSALAEQL